MRDFEYLFVFQEAGPVAESPPDEGGGNRNMSPTLKRASRAFGKYFRPCSKDGHFV